MVGLGIPDNNQNLCKTCKWAKDKWNESCFCIYYGYIVSRGKNKCWGHEVNGKIDNKKENENE